MPAAPATPIASSRRRMNSTSMCRRRSPIARAESYAAYAWPRAFAGIFARNGLVISLIAALSVAAFILGFAAYHDRQILFGVHTGPGAFYKLMPHNAMAALFGAVFLYADGRAGDGRARVLARHRRARRHEGRCRLDLAGDPRRRRAALSRRRRRRLLQRGRPPDRPPKTVSPLHLLRLPALLRVDLRGDALSLSAGARGALCRGGMRRSCSARSAASGFWSGRSDCWPRSGSAIPCWSISSGWGWTRHSS